MKRILLILPLLFQIGCEDEKDEEVHPLIGTWECVKNVDGYMETLTLSFLKNGTFNYSSTDICRIDSVGGGGCPGTYTLLETNITFLFNNWPECDEEGGSFSFSIDNNQLTFSTTSGYLCGEDWDWSWYLEGTWNKL